MHVLLWTTIAVLTLLSATTSLLLYFCLKETAALKKIVTQLKTEQDNLHALLGKRDGELKCLREKLAKFKFMVREL